MKISPTNIPEIAPSLLMDFKKIPKNNAGKIVAAANPNANATTCATNPGGYIPKSPAIIIATAAAHLA